MASEKIAGWMKHDWFNLGEVIEIFSDLKIILPVANTIRWFRSRREKPTPKIRLEIRGTLVGAPAVINGRIVLSRR